MGGFGPDGYQARTEDEIFSSYETAINQEYGGNLEPYEGAIVQSLFLAFGIAVSNNQEQDLENLYDSLFIQSATGDELTKLARGYTVDRKPAVAATGVVEFSRNTTGSSLTIPQGTKVATQAPDQVEYFTTEATTFASNDSTTKANIKASEGGTSGNVGANRVVVLLSPPAGVDGVTNNNPVGDTNFTLTNGETQSLGQDQETDEELRNRVLEGSSIGGSATVRAVRDKIRSLDGTPSLTIYTNRTLNANANGNGLPELSAELVIWAQSITDSKIAQAIHDIVAVTERLASGNQGTAKSSTVTSDTLNSNRTIEWSQPNEKPLEITLDVITKGGYAGDERVKEVISNYVGGTLPDGSPVAGLDVGVDLIVDEMERRINNLNGTVGTTNIVIDDNTDNSDDTTTRSDGLRAYEVGNNEVATVDGTSDITVNTP